MSLLPASSCPLDRVCGMVYICFCVCVIVCVCLSSWCFSCDAWFAMSRGQGGGGSRAIWSWYLCRPLSTGQGLIVEGRACGCPPSTPSVSLPWTSTGHDAPRTVRPPGPVLTAGAAARRPHSEACAKEEEPGLPPLLRARPPGRGGAPSAEAAAVWLMRSPPSSVQVASRMVAPVPAWEVTSLLGYERWIRWYRSCVCRTVSIPRVDSGIDSDGRSPCSHLRGSAGPGAEPLLMTRDIPRPPGRAHGTEQKKRMGCADCTWVHAVPRTHREAATHRRCIVSERRRMALAATWRRTGPRAEGQMVPISAAVPEDRHHVRTQEPQGMCGSVARGVVLQFEGGVQSGTHTVQSACGHGDWMQEKVHPRCPAVYFGGHCLLCLPLD